MQFLSKELIIAILLIASIIVGCAIIQTNEAKEPRQPDPPPWEDPWYGSGEGFDIGT